MQKKRRARGKPAPTAAQEPRREVDSADLYFAGKHGGARVAGPLGRSNDLPIPAHGDSLRQELTDVLYMLDSALGLLQQQRNEAGEQTVRDARLLLQSILGEQRVSGFQTT